MESPTFSFLFFSFQSCKVTASRLSSLDIAWAPTFIPIVHLQIRKNKKKFQYPPIGDFPFNISSHLKGDQEFNTEFKIKLGHITKLELSTLPSMDYKNKTISHHTLFLFISRKQTQKTCHCLNLFDNPKPF